MDLRDRSRTDGLGVEVAIKALQRDLERRLDFLPNPVESDGGERVLQREQVMRGFLADEIGTRCERLAELDRRGADRLKGGGIVGDFRLDSTEASDEAEELYPRRRLRPGFDHAPRAVECEDGAPVGQRGGR